MIGILGVLAYAAVAPLQAPAMPGELSRLVERANLGRVSDWCRAETRSRGRQAYAVAIGANGGRYVALVSNSLVVELARYSDGAELSCYSREEAQKLDRSISESEGIHGSIKPRWSTPVICGFVDYTRAVCWQFSPGHNTYLKVGEWVT